MSLKLYVGNLNYGVDSSALQELFAPHGSVQSAEVISDRMTGRSKARDVLRLGVRVWPGHELDAAIRLDVQHDVRGAVGRQFAGRVGPPVG